MVLNKNIILNTGLVCANKWSFLQITIASNGWHKLTCKSHCRIFSINSCSLLVLCYRNFFRVWNRYFIFSNNFHKKIEFIKTCWLRHQWFQTPNWTNKALLNRACAIFSPTCKLKTTTFYWTKKFDAVTLAF